MIRSGSIGVDVPWCIHEALERDLPAVHFEAHDNGRGYVRPAVDRRPHDVDHAIEVYAWDQAWSNTALGMGVGGNAITHAITTVVVDLTARAAAVYVGQHLRGVIEVDEETMRLISQHAIITGRIPRGKPFTS